MKFDFNVSDFFKLPTKIMFAIALATGLILFLPENIVAKLYMVDFRNKYGFVIGLIFLISVSISIISFIVIIYRYYSNKYYMKKFKDGANDRLKKFSDYQKAIVYYLFSMENHTGELPLHDGAVVWLKNNMVIIETTNQYMVSDLNNAVFPYMLQPWVVEELEKDRGLFEEFRTSFESKIARYQYNK
ncbi:MAG: super-infection exclusion protein B [Clostridium cochlearium]|uniref:super-infection exclusion protein B n=1 Tax=Clostridium cochlearium TaxID=1494 RepID=UPI00280AFA45|nr:super-infection exclusion protein B [Clostridium cochlearium]MDU1442681.1 super-infection exclusion protein B [Clostridium cochlearium]